MGKVSDSEWYTPSSEPLELLLFCLEGRGGRQSRSVFRYYLRSFALTIKKLQTDHEIEVTVGVHSIIFPSLSCCAQQKSYINAWESVAIGRDLLQLRTWDYCADAYLKQKRKSLYADFRKDRADITAANVTTLHRNSAQIFSLR
jgi:hypothetical protein